MTTTLQDLASPDARLTAVHQVRFTEAQDQLLRELTRRTRRPISGVIRDIVVSWAANLVNEEARLADKPDVIDVWGLVAELNSLSELDVDGPER